MPLETRVVLLVLPRRMRLRIEMVMRRVSGLMRVHASSLALTKNEILVLTKKHIRTIVQMRAGGV